MLSNTLPLLVLMQNLTICLEAILEKAQFETVALVHLNTTVDMADNIHQQLMSDTNYAWMRFYMSADNSTTEQSHLLEGHLYKNIFFIYILDEFVDWVLIYKFIILTKFNFRENHIYIVNKYPSNEHIREVVKQAFVRHFFKSVALFWNSSGHGSGLEAYTFNGFQSNSMIKIPIVNDQCGGDIYNQMFPDKLHKLDGRNLSIYGQTEPPKIVRTVAMVNGQYEYGLGGHDVLITDAVVRQLNATPRFNLVSYLLIMVTAIKYEDDISKYLNSVEYVSNLNHTIFS